MAERKLLDDPTAQHWPTDGFAGHRVQLPLRRRRVDDSPALARAVVLYQVPRVQAAAHADGPAIGGGQAADSEELVQRAPLRGGCGDGPPAIPCVMLDKARSCVRRGRPEAVADGPAVAWPLRRSQRPAM